MMLANSANVAARVGVRRDYLYPCSLPVSDRAGTVRFWSLAASIE
jgi:hypothetical protein